MTRAIHRLALAALATSIMALAPHEATSAEPSHVEGQPYGHETATKTLSAKQQTRLRPIAAMVGQGKPDRDILAAFRGVMKALPGTDVTAALFYLFKTAIDEQNDDKRAWLQKLAEMNAVAEAMGNYLKELNEALGSASSTPRVNTTTMLLCRGEPLAKVRKLPPRLRPVKRAELKSWVSQCTRAEATAKRHAAQADEGAKRATSRLAAIRKRRVPLEEKLRAAVK